MPGKKACMLKKDGICNDSSSINNHLVFIHELVLDFREKNEILERMTTVSNFVGMRIAASCFATGE